MKRDIDEILADYLNKEPLTEEEQQAWEEWVNVSERNRKFGNVIRKLEGQKKTLDGHRKQDAVFAEIERQVQQTKTKRKRRLVLWSSYAAGIALLIGFFFLWEWKNAVNENTPGQMQFSALWVESSGAELILPNGEKRLLNSEKTSVIVSDSSGEIRADKNNLIVKTNETGERKPEYYTLNIPYGTEYTLFLPDHTKIYLNAGSSLRYPDQFSGDKREVFLSGEAYFEVTSDSLHPFIVHTEDVAIQVLGTAFNVNAYSDEAWVKTTLVEGRVEARYGNNSLVMKPGTQVAYNRETRTAEYFPVNTLLYTSWKDGFYDFEDMPLGELMQIFSRWYNLKIEFADPELKTIRFSGRLKRYDDLKPLFNMLEYTRDIVFVMEKDRVMIQKK